MTEYPADNYFEELFSDDSKDDGGARWCKYCGQHECRCHSMGIFDDGDTNYCACPPEWQTTEGWCEWRRRVRFEQNTLDVVKERYVPDFWLRVVREPDVQLDIEWLISEVERQAARLAEIDHAGFLRWTIDAIGSLAFNKDNICCYQLTNFHTDAHGIHMYLPTSWHIRTYMHYDGGRDLPNPEGTLAAAQAIAQAEYDELMKGVRIG